MNGWRLGVRTNLGDRVDGVEEPDLQKAGQARPHDSGRRIRQGVNHLNGPGFCLLSRHFGELTRSCTLWKLLKMKGAATERRVAREMWTALRVGSSNPAEAIWDKILCALLPDASALRGLLGRCVSCLLRCIRARLTRV